MKAYFLDQFLCARSNRLQNPIKLLLLSTLVILLLAFISTPAYPWLSNPFQSIVSSLSTTTTTKNTTTTITNSITTTYAPPPSDGTPPAPPPLATANSSLPPPPPLPSLPPDPPTFKSIAKECDIFRGEWEVDTEEPYYTNTTCWVIPDPQNCMKFGRPNLDYLKWRWKPDGCEMPRFDAAEFLEVVRGKSLAFVGDSVAGNQMYSLLCLLSKVEYPKDIPFDSNHNLHKWSKHVIYTNYNFTMTMFWSPFLIKVEEAKPADKNDSTNLDKLYLDKVDKSWLSKISNYDYVMMSARHWFSRPSLFYEKGKIVGCCYCHVNNVTDLTVAYSHRMAFRTAFRAINKLARFNGMLILRTVSPSHFEYGEWNKGGDCPKTMPFRSNETKFEGQDFDLYKAQVEEFEKAKMEADKKGMVFKLLDVMPAMLRRPDGHPGRYGHLVRENETHYNDCLHWCMPGPIDTWNDFLLQMLMR